MATTCWREPPSIKIDFTDSLIARTPALRRKSCRHPQGKGRRTWEGSAHSSPHGRQQACARWHRRFDSRQNRKPTDRNIYGHPRSRRRAHRKHHRASPQKLRDQRVQAGRHSCSLRAQRDGKRLHPQRPRDAPTSARPRPCAWRSPRPGDASCTRPWRRRTRSSWRCHPRTQHPQDP